MNADPFRKLPTEKQYRDDLARWPDMHQMPEPEEPSRASHYFAVGCIALCIGIIVGTWIIIATDPAVIGGPW